MTVASMTLNRTITPEVTVIGGANIDIAARHASAHHHPADSVRGDVSLSAGGVARNITETLGRLGGKVNLITALGGDDFAQIIRNSLNLPAIDHTASHHEQAGRSDCYLSILDQQGELIQAINQMVQVDRLTPHYLEHYQDQITSSQRLIADCNLPAESLEWLARLEMRPALYIDGVSAQKIIKLKPVLHRIDGLKCNTKEAATLLEMPESTSPEDLIDALITSGIKTALISLGEDGVIFSRGGEIIRKDALPLPEEITSVTGAGDALFAGFIYGDLIKASLSDALMLGMEAARLTLTCAEAVHPQIASILTKYR